MKASTFFAAASLALTAFAAPVDKRDQLIVVYATTTTEVLETIWTTVWVDEATPVAQFYETHAAVTTVAPVLALTSFAPVAVAQVASSPAAPVVQIASSPAVPVAQVASSPTLSVAQVASSSAAPVAQAIANTSAAPVVQPSTSTPAPAPTTTAVQVPAPVVQASVSSVVAAVASPVAAPSPVVAAAAPVSSVAAGSASYPNSGDITYYDVSVGLSSCGLQGQNSEDLVALSPAMMANGANPNANPKCGSKIEISYGGNTHIATVFDTCPGCTGGSIDLTQELFQKVAPNGDGRVSGVSWRFMS